MPHPQSIGPHTSLKTPPPSFLSNHHLSIPSSSISSPLSVTALVSRISPPLPLSPPSLGNLIDLITTGTPSKAT
ncbi:Sulfotransferase 1C1 [Clarias magur]|uniref:Sulfotransferase 1C1 n=1 Tax=Clarias magur TaxID=1594786 RepID=A0A8J4T7K5_CLAMG|nr:Sulfotransferase 1C1 [Clarias magur]